MAEVVFALRIILDVFPFEVNTATGAFLADRLEKIHGGYKSPLGAGDAFEKFYGWSTDML